MADGEALVDSGTDVLEAGRCASVASDNGSSSRVVVEVLITPSSSKPSPIT